MLLRIRDKRMLFASGGAALSASGLACWLLVLYVGSPRVDRSSAARPAAQDQADRAADAPGVHPFWRQTADVLAFAPDWWANRGPVTQELYYDSSRSFAENGAALVEALNDLSAGDHVRIHAGTWQIDSRLLIRACGTARRPITVAGAEGEAVVFSQHDAEHNVLDIDATQYMILEGIKLQGGSQGLRLHGVNHFVLHNTEVCDTKGNAVTANSRNTSHLFLIGNHLHDTGGHGEGFYLGSHDGKVVTHHTFVIGNYIHDLNSSDVDQGDGIEVKDRSYAVTIKYNFIADTNYPGILVYGTGRGIEDRNIIEENVVLRSNDAGIQASAEAIIRNNMVVTGKTAFLSKPFTTNPKHLTVANNTFIAGGTAVTTSGWNAADATEILFANNAIHSAGGQSRLTRMGNARVSANLFVADLSLAFVDLTLDGLGLNATPAADSLLIGAADPEHLPDVDLHGGKRNSADVGAVARAVGSK